MLSGHKKTALIYDLFHQDGYLVLENFVPEAECDKLLNRMDILVQDFAAKGEITSIFSTINHQYAKDHYFLESAHKILFFFEEEAIVGETLKYSVHQSLNKVGHALHMQDPVFQEFCLQGKFTSLIQDLGYEEPMIRQSMYIFKQPHIGGKVVMHQDATFLHTNNKPVLGLWLALEDATRDNGCLWVIPGGHMSSLRQKFMRYEDDHLGFEMLDTTPFPGQLAVPLEVKKGTAIVLHGYLPHASEKNTSGQSRHAFTLHFTDKQDGFPGTNWMRGYTASR